MPGDAAPVVKVGLIAPFEGVGRPLGYAVLPAVKVALDEANASGRLGRYRAALVALNDSNDPATAARQGASLVEDKDVLTALGPWSSAAVTPTLAELDAGNIAGLVAAPAAALAPRWGSLCPGPDAVAAPLIGAAASLSPAVSAPAMAYGGAAGPLLDSLRVVSSLYAVNPLGSTQENPYIYTGDAEQAADDLVRWRTAGWRGVLLGGPDLARSWYPERAGELAEGSLAYICRPAEALPPGFAAAYAAHGGGIPGPDAELAYSGARALIDALAADIQKHGRPTRAGVAGELAHRPLPARIAPVMVKDGKWQESD